jgi:hypothetical protein
LRKKLTENVNKMQVCLFKLIICHGDLLEGKSLLLGSKFVCDCKLLSCAHMEAKVHLNIELKWYVGPSPRDSPDK